MKSKMKMRSMRRLKRKRGSTNVSAELRNATSTGVKVAVNRSAKTAEREAKISWSDKREKWC